MQLFFKRKALLFLLTFLLFIIAEMTVYLIIFNTLVATNFILEMALILAILSPSFLFKNNKVVISYHATVLSLCLLLFAINLTLDYTSRDIFTFAYLMNAGEAAVVFDWDYLNWLALLVFFGFSGLYVLGIFFIYKKLAKGNDDLNVKYLPKGAIISLGLTILALISSTISLHTIKEEYSENEIFKDMNGYQIVQYLSRYLKKTSMKKYGVLNYSLATTNRNPIITTTISIADETVEENVDDPILSKTDAYYGLLKDYNVIEIMIESGSEYLVDKTLTPNLYKLREEGIYFTNNYSKNKTNISECIGITGAAISNIQYFEGNIPYSMPNMLKEYGYHTQYFHNNYGEFYNRYKEMVYLGFDSINFSLDINESRQWYNSFDGNYPLDSETMSDILEDIAPVNLDKPYYSFFTSLSMHGPYIGEDNWQKFIDLGYVSKLNEAKENGLWQNPCFDDDEAVQHQIEMVMCETMDFDYAVGMLMNYLEETNQMDNTLLVLYGDHETYFSVGIDKPLKEYVYNVDDEKNPCQYETMMFIYNEKLTKKYKVENGIEDTDFAYYNDFTSPYILVPTMLELLGVEYKKEVYTGVSIFQTTSILDNAFYSNELGSLFTDKVYSIDVSNEFVYVEEGVSQEYLNEFQKNVTILLEKIDSIEKMYLTGSYLEENV